MIFRFIYSIQNKGITYKKIHHLNSFFLLIIDPELLLVQLVRTSSKSIFESISNMTFDSMVACCQPIRSHVRKSLSINMDFDMEIFLAATKQLYEWFSPSVCPYIRLSHLDYVPLIALSWNFLEWLLLTKVMSMQKFKVRGQRSRSQEVKTQLSCFRTVILVLIHIWRRNDVQGLMWHRRCALLFFKVIRHISRSHRTKHSQFWPSLGISGL